MAVIRIFSKVLAILFAVILITAPVSTALAAGDSWKDNTQGNKPTDDKSRDAKSGDDKASNDISQNKSEDKKSKDDESHNNKPEKPGEKDDDDEKSRQKLKDRMKSLLSVSTPPLNLKQQAHEDISSIIPAENKNNKDIIKKLGSAELHIAASIDPGAWYGENRLKPVQKYDDGDSEDGDDDSDDNYDESESEIETTVFKDERTAAKNILEIISKNKDDTIDDELLIDILINLVQADRNIAQTSITDLQRAVAITNLEDNDESEDADNDNDDLQKKLKKALKDFEKANEMIEKGEPIDAIKHFEKAWERATTELVNLDAATAPIIIFDSLDNPYINGTDLILIGHVEDAAVYTIPNITLTVNGATSVLDLTGGIFESPLSLHEGDNNISVTVTDAFENTGTAKITIIVDTVLPVISSDGAQDGLYYNTPVSVSANMSDEHPDTLTILVNGNPYTSGTPIIAEGAYAVDITARDMAGNTARQSLTFHIDMTPPVITIAEPANGSFASGAVTVNHTVTDESPVITSMLADGINIIPADSVGTHVLDTAAYADGMHNITVTAIDAAGNTATEGISIIVDNTPPEVTILKPLDNEAIRGMREILAHVYDLYLKGITISINDEAVSTTSNHTFDTLNYSDGSYNISAEVVDYANNTGADVISVIVDNTPPVINITSPVNNSFAKGAVSVDANITEINTASVNVTIDGILLSSSLPAAWDTTIYPDGPHAAGIYVRDTAANTAAVSVYITVDNTPPAVSLTSPANSSALRGIINITADIHDTYLANTTISINGTAISSTSGYTWNTTAYPDGWYNITAAAADMAENAGRHEIWVEVDNTPPVIDITSPVNNSFVKGAVSVDANITEANTADVDVTINGILLSSSVPAAWDTTIYLDGPHTASIYVTDTAHNTAATSVSVTVDNTPPAVSLTSPANSSALRGVVDITADVSDTYLANTGISIDGTAVSNTSGYTWNTTAYPDGWYNITATAADMAENTGRHDIWVEVDNTPPELAVNELTDNPTLAEPQYTINGTVKTGAILTIDGNRTSHSGTFEYTTNVTEGTNTITVTATDAAGNTATWTKTRMVDTDLLPDYYELNVTGTDPLDGDSDSSLTPENEAANGITDDMETFGSDDLPTLINMRIGTNPLKEDTDADGLTDEFELLKLGLLTDPTSGTTDGIPDAAADIDEDGLTNIEEQTYGTDPLVPDTDGDGLTDKEEIVAGTDPLIKDTDGDGLEDGSEILLGLLTDPNNPDSDGNGLNDSVETYIDQTVENELAFLQIDGVGDLTRTTNVTNASGFVPLAEMAGSIGNIVDITTSSQFTSATISIPYNESELNGAPEDDLRMYYINETDHSITFLDAQGVDAANNVVWGDTDHFSTFGIVSYTSYMTVWDSGSNPTVPEYTYGDRMNIKAQVHNTGDAAVSGNVLVYFYEGNPDAGGSYIGSATISGGISKGGAKTATLYGYTITSSAVDIYVKVDPLNSIAELSESNNKASKTLSIGPQNFDSDGDGLTDWDETNGMRTSFGTIRTDPNNPDSDGDGLSDGEEMGARFNSYYYMVSNPRKSNSDNDGLDDLSEIIGGLNPLNVDSDFDSFIDGFDDDPFTPYQPEPEISLLIMGRQIVLGATFGEMGLEGGSLHYLIGEDSYSTYYLIGWIGFSLIPGVGALADVRDAAQAIINGDAVGAVMNAAGAIPGPGDAAKTSGAVFLFIGKFGGDTKRVTKVGKHLARTILKYTPDSVTTPILKAVYGDVEVARVMSKGALAGDLRKLTARGIHLKDVRHITQVGGEFIPTLYGDVKSGWVHYYGRHVTGSIKVGNDGTTIFPMKDLPVLWQGKAYPGKSSLTDVDLQKMIDDALKSQLSEWPTVSKNVRIRFPTEKYGIKEMEVWLNPNKGVATTFPREGTEVYKWFNGKWNPTIR